MGGPEPPKPPVDVSVVGLQDCSTGCIAVRLDTTVDETRSLR